MFFYHYAAGRKRKMVVNKSDEKQETGEKSMIVSICSKILQEKLLKK